MSDAHGTDADLTSAAFDLPADAVEKASIDNPVAKSRHRRLRGPMADWTQRGRRLGAGSLVALRSAVAVGVPANAEKPRVTRTCADVGELPCVVSAGETYAGTLAPKSGNDRQPVLEAVLADVLGGEVRVDPVAVGLTRETAAFELTPDVVRGVQRFDWRHLAGDDPVAYITVKASTAFAIIGVAGTTAGTVDVGELLAGHEISHIGFWSLTVTPGRPVRASAVHGEDVLGNTRLAAIEGGSVACMHIETLEVRRCPFNENSGDWIESLEGDFAVTGQAVSPDGGPEEQYVVASKVEPDGRVPALEPSGHDSAGVASGVELAGAAMLERLGSATNASGRALRNYATLEVCTGTYPHPDGAQLSSTPAPGVFCYIGEGAGLNDRYGTERDEFGAYYPGTLYAHTGWSNGYEVPVGKRPSSGGWPLQVFPTSPLAWRPVAWHLTIANGPT